MLSRELIRDAIAGEAAARERLLSAMWPIAFRIAQGIVRDSGDSQDAAQEACIVLYREIPSLRNDYAFDAWFYRVVVREASKVVRRRSRSQKTEFAGAPVQEAFDPSDRIDLSRALQRLPERLRTILVLRYYADLTSRQIGVVLRIPAPTVRFRLAIAKRRLAETLSVPAHPHRIQEIPSNAV